MQLRQHLAVTPSSTTAGARRSGPRSLAAAGPEFISYLL
jgi:hypothetical protein